MKFFCSIIFSLLASLGGYAQQHSQTGKSPVFLPENPVDVNFLLSYYEQEGNHSAVTGGVGTEELTDLASKVTVNVPVDSAKRILAGFTINHYTSASTDNIDFAVSSASSKDSRAAISLGYEWDQPQKKVTWTVGSGMSIESDYLSTFFSAGWWKEAADGNRSIHLMGQAFLDTWVVIFPEELRDPGLASVPTDKRRSFHLSATFNQIINQRLQASFSSELVVQQGLLSTPFHRVYFEGLELPRIERLPGFRIKYPLGVRISYFPMDFMILRGYYRFYYDSFNILAHTSSLEIPLKIGPFFSVYPFYRIHYQRQAQYFATFGAHLPEDEFYTSDFDLSTFHSHKLGGGVSISPVYGIARFRQKSGRMGQLKNIDLRYSIYRRSDGLSSFIGSVDLGFLF